MRMDIPTLRTTVCGFGNNKFISNRCVHIEYHHWTKTYPCSKSGMEAEVTEWTVFAQSTYLLFITIPIEYAANPLKGKQPTWLHFKRIIHFRFHSNIFQWLGYALYRISMHEKRKPPLTHQADVAENLFCNQYLRGIEWKDSIRLVN